MLVETDPVVRKTSITVRLAVLAIRSAVLVLLLTVGAATWLILRARAYRLDATQRRVLMRIIRRNEGTFLGKRLDLSDCRSLEDFRARKQVTNYEFFRPYVDESLRTGENLIAADPITGFTSTSGTTAEPKRILLTRRSLTKERRKEVILALFNIFSRKPSLFYRPVLLMIAGEERSAVGRSTHKAAANALFRQNFFGRFSIVPPLLYDLADYEAKYYYYALLSLRCGARLFITSNPSSLVKLHDTRARYCDWLSQDLVADRLTNRFGISDDLLHAIAARLGSVRPRPEGTDFPDLAAVACWRSGPSAFFAERLARMMDPNVRFFDLGYLASDTPLTYRIGPGGEQVCAFDRLFFEFIPIADDADEGAVPLVYSEIVTGDLYRIVITNDHGLYRYDIGDIVRAVGWFGGVPLVEFVRKVEGFSNMTGEKLSEDQTISAVTRATRESGLSLRFFALTPDLPSSSYHLYLEAEISCAARRETLEREIDEALKADNLEYRAKRESGRLGAVAIRQVASGTFDACKLELVSQGRREAQFKLPHLIVDERLRDLLARRVVA